MLTDADPPTRKAELTVPGSDQSVDDALVELLRRLDADPFDADVRFDLGVELTRRGHEEMGSKHLDRSFKIAPQGILKLIADPTLAPVRETPEVERVLRAHHREHTRRIYAAYA